MKHDDFFNSFADFMVNGDTQNVTTFLPEPDQQHLLSIYRNGFFKSSISALQANFPTINTLLGEDYFKSAAIEFIQHTPPQQSALVMYGQSWPDYLDKQLSDLPYIGDFARLDRGWLTCLNETDDTPIDSAQFQALITQFDDPDELPVTSVSSLQLVELNYPALSLWAQVKQSQLTENQSLISEKQYILFWKVDGDVRVQSTTKEQWLFMHQLHQGASLSAAAEYVLSSEPAFELSNFLALLLDNKLLR